MTFVVEAIYDGGPTLKGREDERWPCETVEEAAQRFESEAEPFNFPLGQIVEDLAVEGKVEYEDPESCRVFVAYAAAGVVA